MSEQQQKVGNNSTAIQVHGDYCSSSYTEIKAIFLDLFKLNFPTIQRIAAKKAQERINMMLDQLRVSLDKQKDNIDTAKFSEPSVQFEMQTIAVNAARRGEQGNIELLCELLSGILTKDCPELFELISGEACRVVPLLSKRHIAFLSLEVLVDEASVVLADSSPSDLNAALVETLSHISEANNISNSDLQYIACTGTVEPGRIPIWGEVPNVAKKIDAFKDKNFGEIKSYCSTSRLVNIINLFNMIERCKSGHYRLTAVGRLIGWLNISQCVSIDVKKLFE